MKTLIVLISLLVSTVAVAQTRTSIVTVYSEQGKGTGFFVTRNLIMTNHHVVCEDNPYDDCEPDVVVGHRLYKVAGKVVAHDAPLDLALVFVGGSGPRPFTFCDSAMIGDEVEVWTFEFGRFKIRQGVILQAWINKYVTSTGLISGNSGSPLMKKIGPLKYCVAGVSKSTYTSNNQAIHVNEYQARKFLNKYLSSGSVK